MSTRFQEESGSVSPQDNSSDEDTEDASEGESDSRPDSLIASGKGSTYSERLAMLQGQLDRLEEGRDSEYLRQCSDLENLRDQRIFMAETWLLCEIERIQKDYEREMEQAQEEFEAKKQELKECLSQDILDKQRNAEADRTGLDLAVELIDTKPMTTRKLRRRLNEPLPTQDKRRKNTSLSSLMYVLSDSEIMDDLRSIYKGKSNMLTKSHIQSNTSDGGTYDAKIEDGKLYYNRKWFHKNQHVLLESVEHGQDCGVITAISSNEISIACLPDHSKLRVNLSQLIKGKYILKRRSA
jgi:Sin3 histone deacetylase corepressor complex component SDS3